MSVEILFKAPNIKNKTGIIDTWTIKEHSIVAKDQIICKVIAGDTIVEISSPISGILLKKFYTEGNEIYDYTVIGAIGSSNSTILNLKPPLYESRDDHVIKIKGIKKIVASRMHTSLQETAQLTMTSQANVSGVLAFRKKCKNSKDSTIQEITINDIILWIVSRVLCEHSYMNAHITNDSIIVRGKINLGFAVNAPRGLIVPVIHDARKHSLTELAAETKRLATLCIAGKIAPENLADGTFTVTNLGTYGINYFTPILNTPEVGILGLGGIEDKAIKIGEEMQYIPHISLSLTIDHQAVDGAPGAQFVASLTKAIANFPYSLDAMI